MKYIARLFFWSSIGFLSFLFADQAGLPFKPYPQDLRLIQSEPLANGERHIVIISCSYNNAQFYAWNLESVIGQEYNNYHVIYIDDCSSDHTYDLVQKYVQDHLVQDRFILFKNDINRKALANLYYAIHTCKPTDIIVILDGDDSFAHTKVLQRINQVYADTNIWLTYGQFREYPNGRLGFCRPYPKHIIESNAFRRWPDTPSHLRTFYAGLFHKIKQEDLLFKGEFFSMTYDLAIMFPMIEMARKHHTYIDDVLVHYNGDNPINDHRISKELQRKFDLIIRARANYSDISSPF